MSAKLLTPLIYFQLITASAFKEFHWDVFVNGQQSVLSVSGNTTDELLTKLSNTTCQSFMSNGKRDLCVISMMHTLLDSFLSSTGGSFEGNSGQYLEQLRLYKVIASRPWVHSVCEIGFNAGHGALTWLSAQDSNGHHSLKVLVSFVVMINDASPQKNFI